LADGRHEAGKDRMLELLTIMSDDNHDQPLIRNEDTLRRRAWIDRALAGVRGRLKPAELGEAPTPSEPAGSDSAGDVPAEDAGRPHLYLVRNPNSR
jgi:hypothetical protein